MSDQHVSGQGVNNYREIPRASDTLGDTLYSLRLDGVIYASSELISPWGIAMPALSGKMMFHIVTEGGCWLRFKDGESHYLKPGELALIPRGEGHCISDTTKQRCAPFFDIPVIRLSDRFELIRYGGRSQANNTHSSNGPPDTRLTCGVLNFDQVLGKKLINQLPQIIHITSDDDTSTQHLQTLLQLMGQEARTLSPGGETVIANLADIIVIRALRHWLSHSPQANIGWLGALKDPKLGKALTAIHNSPETSWTVQQLAQQAGMSRSGFSARFTEVIGTSVKQYVTDWRMNLARLRIMQSDVTLAQLADELGYQSEAAFSRAYKRVVGEPPMRARATAE
ncbi:cupin [Thalassolituus sp. HI0120]|nr:cupin [Thalassolituus sp. HI0120]